MTTDAVQICHVIFNDKDGWQVDNLGKWIDDVSKESKYHLRFLIKYKEITNKNQLYKAFVLVRILVMLI